MDARADDRAMSALLRLMAVRAPGAEIAVYAVGPQRIRLAASSSAAARLAAERVAADWRALAPRVAPLLAAGGWTRVDPAVFGLGEGFGALCPLHGPDGAPIGFLLLRDPLRRRLNPGLAHALADAARIAAPLLIAAAPARHRTPAGGPSQSGLAARALLVRAEAVLRRATRDAPSSPARRDVALPAAAGGDGGLARDLAAAERRGQLRLAYQGYLDLANDRIAGFEALLRWRHPSRGDLAPTAFIPLAEASGLIQPLGAWALRSALAAAAHWPQRLALSVNVSALQFHQPDFVAEIDAALAGAGVAPERLELEITESVLMRDHPETTAQLEALIARGVRIALDDFGTGYSALAYLRRLPHHRIKLDRAFVRDLGNPATLELVRAIIALAQRTGVAVTAEGVERADQLELVRGLGFTHAQGFVTGPPVEDPLARLDGAPPNRDETVS